MSMNYRILKWLGAGIAFAATVCAPGCSLLPGSHSGQQTPTPVAETPQAPPATKERPLTATPGSERSGDLDPSRVHVANPESVAPPVVNVFGELDGIERHPMPGASEFGIQQHTICDEGYDADVTVDPSGKWLAFTSTRHSEQPDVYLQRVDGTSVVQLTTDPAADAQPSWSPDGKRMAFCSTRSGNWDIYLMDADGKNVEQLTNSASQEMHPSFSPDGTRIAYCSLSPRTDQWELWVMDLATHAKRTIGQGLFPAWSPQKDVDRIAFQRARQRGSRWFSVWTLDLVNGEPTRLTEVAVSSNAAVVSPSWSPDGKRLAFATIPQSRLGNASSSLQQDIWVASADGANRQRLTHGDATNLSPIWAVDNRIYFISDRAGHENVWSVHVDAGKAVTATASDTASGASTERVATETRDTRAAEKAREAQPPAAVGAADAREIAH
ncbi:MAG: TolB family protein [Bacillota bacterium]